MVYKGPKGLSLGQSPVSWPKGKQSGRLWQWAQGDSSMLTLQTLTTHPAVRFPEAALQESLWCITHIQPQAVLVICSKHAFPLAVLVAWKTNHPPGCQSFLPLPTPHTPLPHAQSNICQPSPIKFCSSWASLLCMPGLSCGPTSFISCLYGPTSSLFPHQSTRHMAPSISTHIMYLEKHN